MIRRHFVRTRTGMVHIAEAGTGKPVFLLHQTPRSWTEYQSVLPILGRTHRAIAMDTRGFGDSEPLTGPPSIEGWAAALLDLADAMEIDEFAVCGHHTGAYIALETAAQAPARVTALVASAISFIDAEVRALRTGKPSVDDSIYQDDGSHLLSLWSNRRPSYTMDNCATLMNRYMIDALRCGQMASEGHRVVGRYQMESRIGDVRSRTLIVAPMADMHASPTRHRVVAALPGADLVEIEGGTSALPEQFPEEFASVISHFL